MTAEMTRTIRSLLAFVALALAGLIALAAPARAASLADAQGLPVTMAAADAQFDRMVGRIAQLDPAAAQAEPRYRQIAFLKPLVRLLSKIVRGVKKLAGIIQKGVQKLIKLGRTIQQAISDIAHGVATGVAKVIFKPLPPTIRGILVTAAGAYGEALLTGKFWGTKLGRNINKWVGRLDQIDGELDRIKERMDKLQECLRNPLTCSWTKEKIDEKLSELRRSKIDLQKEKIRSMERIRDIRHGIRPPPMLPRIPASPPPAPPRTTEGTGRRG